MVAVALPAVVLLLSPFFLAEGRWSEYSSDALAAMSSEVSVPSHTVAIENKTTSGAVEAPAATAAAASLVAAAKKDHLLLDDLKALHGIKFNDLTGNSSCEAGKQCMALTFLFSNWIKSSDLKDQNTCVGVSEDLAKTENQCGFLCGMISNVAYHKNVLAGLQKYAYDMVLMHDETVTASQLKMFQNLGMRTYLLGDDIKRLYLSGLQKVGGWGMDDIDVETTPFDDEHVSFRNLKRAFLQLKLGATTLTEYDYIVFSDFDAYLSETFEKELDWFQAHTEIKFVSFRTGKSPINAGHWIIEPSLKAAKIWLDDISTGFTYESGWNKVGKVMPSHISKDGSWKFTGAEMDQGLLYHIYGWEFRAALSWRTNLDNLEPLRGIQYSNAENGFVTHIQGQSAKPWFKNACAVKGKSMSKSRGHKLNNLAKPLYTAVAETDLASIGLDPTLQAFMNSECTPILKRNAQTC